MTEQTDAAEVEALEDLMHRLLGRACDDVSDLDAPPCWTFAQRILASDWLAAREAAAEARGAERAWDERNAAGEQDLANPYRAAAAGGAR